MQQTHPGISKRLLRARGHLDHIIGMLDEGRPCVELAQQLQAVEKAIGAAKKALIHDHLDHCLQEVKPGGGKSRSSSLVEDFRRISKFL